MPSLLPSNCSSGDLTDMVGVFKAGEPPFIIRFGIAMENFLRVGGDLAAVVSFGEPPLLLGVLAAAVMMTSVSSLFVVWHSTELKPRDSDGKCTYAEFERRTCQTCQDSKMQQCCAQLACRAKSLSGAQGRMPPCHRLISCFHASQSAIVLGVFRHCCIRARATYCTGMQLALELI